MAKDAARVLLDLKEQIAEAETETTKAEGAFEQLTKQLKEKYDVHSVKEAEGLLKKMEVDLEKLDEEIGQRAKQLEEKYM